MSHVLDIIAQAEITVSPATIAVGYGPLGLFCWWLTRLVERQRADSRRQQDVFIQVIKDNTHKISGMSMAMTLNAATYGPENIRVLANRELEKRGRMPDTWDVPGRKT